VQHHRHEVVAVTISVFNPSNYLEPATRVEDFEKISIWRLPKLIWIGLALFCTNIVIGTGVLETPEIHMDVYGKEVQSAYVAGAPKPSPFAVTVDTAKHKVRLAEKLYPASFTVSAVGLTQPASFDTYAPVPTQPAVYNTDNHYQVRQAIDVIPRRASENDGKFVVIN
jgi:hypothetical protein